MTSRFFYLIPLFVFLILAAYFSIGLTKDPKQLPNMLADKPVPYFHLKPIKGRDTQGFSSAQLVGAISLVNVFGSWCVACQAEHAFLMKIKEVGAIPIHGINWREKDADSGPAWLKDYGDPYTFVGNDPNSRAAIAFGVTGAPETFLVDAQGIVRHKVTGPITEEIWKSTLGPMIDRLREHGAS